MRLHTRIRCLLDARRNVVRAGPDYVVAGMATMPSRAATFGPAFQSMLRQVDRLYLYLDGHDRVPEIATGDPRVVPILAKDVPGLHANGKLLGLMLETRPCIYVCADDDLYFPRDYVATLRTCLARYHDHAVVGLHGSVLARPFVRYNAGRRLISYTDRLGDDWKVDVLGTGAVLFSSSVLRFDVRRWPHGNMADLGLAIEAKRAGVPLISIARRTKRVFALAVNQEDSLVVSRAKDDTRQTALARQLLGLEKEPSRKAAKLAAH
jgi:hypothetical protein